MKLLSAQLLVVATLLLLGTTVKSDEHSKLQNYLANNRAIKLSVLHDTYKKIHTQNIGEGILQFNTDRLELGKMKDKNEIKIIPFNHPALEGTEFYVTVQYLPFQLAKATFMELNDMYETEGAMWFITDQLSGCELWIATQEDSNLIYVIHVNYGDVIPEGETRMTIAEAKAIAAQNTLTEINRITRGNFKFVHRVMYLPPLPTIAKEEEKNEYTQYVKYMHNFQNENKMVKVGTYQDIPTLFYAKHVDEPDSLGVYRGWEFRHQGIDMGQSGFKFYNYKSRDEL